MEHLKLGEILINQKLITEKQLDQAIEYQKTDKGRIGEILISLNIISEEDMIAALGSQLGIPYYTSENAELLKPQKDQDLDKLIPADFAQKNTAMPLSKHLNSLTCAVHDPLDLLLLDNLRRITGHEINLVLAPKSVIQKTINDFYFHSGGDESGDAKSSMLSDAVQKSYQKKDDGKKVSIKKSPGNNRA